MFLRCFVSLLIALTTVLHVDACGGDKPISLCCTGVAAWVNNPFLWGEICGYYPPDQLELIGARCIPHPSGDCPPGTQPTCCSGTWPGPSGECALGTGCGVPTITPRDTFPPGWTQASACAQDNGSRVIYNDVIALLPDNTPAKCVAHCAATGYAFAGVEYGNECHCGTGFLPGTPFDIDPSQCSVPCSGDSSQTCGGSWAIQLYTGPSPGELVRRETLPSGWFLLRFCGVDEANRVIINDVVTILPNNTPATCVQHCVNLGLNYAGVEYGSECHCGTEYTGGARAPTADCNIPCSGDPSLTCGGSWRIQIYTSDPNASD